MLYSFKPVNHTIYLFHEHIAHIFRQVFLHDPAKFDDNLLVRPEFLPILNSAKVSIKQPLEEIVQLFHTLPDKGKNQLRQAFITNNNIASFENKNIKPIKFTDLNNTVIAAKLKSFFEDLWNDYHQVNQMLTDFGTVKSHYDDLTHEDNCIGIVCPFCGIDTFEPSGGKYREAYDHLLAKADYPFVSINFNLMVPTCHKCNSNEKRKTDTLFNDDGSRRVVYYPYDTSIFLDDLEISVIPDIPYDAYKLESLLKSVSWHFEFRRAGISDERLTSWDDIYQVKRRYFEWLRRLEKVWFGELQQSYKRDYELYVPFNTFRDDFMKKAKYQIANDSMGIIRHTYYSFLFSTKDFENRLFETIA